MENPSVPVVPALPAEPSAELRDPFGQPMHAERQTGDGARGQHQGGIRRRLGSMLAALVAAIKVMLLALPKLKLLTTGGTAVVSVLAYALWFGLPFAIGLVLLLFVHEMGHVIQLRREGVPASAPMFIPFMGAVVMMRAMPDDALAEARVGLAGPILGTAGSAVCLGIAEVTNSDLLRALAYFGFLINLLNLVPVVPFDGGRAMAAMAPVMWFVGLGAVVFFMLLTNNLFLLLFAALGGYETYRRWKARKAGSPEQAAYYRVSPRNRLLVGIVYVGLIVVLALGMDAAHILNTAGHSFRSV